MRGIDGKAFRGKRVSMTLFITPNDLSTDRNPVPYYIFSQIFGAFIAGLLMMGMYWPEIQAYQAAALAKGIPAISNGGAASILCTFPNPKQNNLGYLFLIEWFVDSYIVGARALDEWYPGMLTGR